MKGNYREEPTFPWPRGFTEWSIFLFILTSGFYAVFSAGRILANYFLT